MSASQRLKHSPSLLDWTAADKALVRWCRVGEGLSVLLIANVAPRTACLGMGALYLSYCSVGSPFLNYQWDALLVETALHGALIAPSGLRPGVGPEPSRVSVGLMRGLVFRLYFGSGWAKLQSRDETWRKLTALAHFHETAPLPNRVGWRAHQLPLGVQKVSTAGSLFVELALPFAVFGPRPLRLLSFLGFTGLQALIALTGNYAFFNLLSAALGLWVLDDELLGARRSLRRHRRPRRLKGAVESALQLSFLALSVTTFHVPLLSRFSAGRRLESAADALAPFRVLNRYGLFSAMTTERPEIVLEGSQDGQTWKELPFRYKPGALDRAPTQVAPHQPRLDWQMWFAALGASSPWMVTLAQRILEGAPEVLRLLGKNPFGKQAPRFVRALLYDYRMARPSERRQTGHYWTRGLLGTYLPPVRLG
jgi:lipase maturation factor 1